MITALIAVAVAFPAGWLLCRVLLLPRSVGDSDGDVISITRHHALLKAQRSRYRRRVQLIHRVVRRHEATRDQIRDRLNKVQQRMSIDAAERDAMLRDLEDRGGQIEKLRKQADEQANEIERLQSAQSNQPKAEPEVAESQDLSLLRIERDELLGRVQRLEEAAATAETSSAAADMFTSLRAECGELRERLGDRERAAKRLEVQLLDRDNHIEELKQEVESWKRRLAPMAQQLRQHREALRGAAAEPQAQPVEQAADQTIEAPPEADPDDLQQIRGIGPALERRLRNQGVTTFRELAQMSESDLETLATKLGIAPALPGRDQWVAQARRLAEDQLADATQPMEALQDSA